MSEMAKNPVAVALGRLGGLKGGKARAEKLSAKERKEIAKKAAAARWAMNNVMPLSFPNKASQVGREEARFPLSDGHAQIRVPNNMTADDLETLFEVYLAGWKKVLEKEIKARSEQ